MLGESITDINWNQFSFGALCSSLTQAEKADSVSACSVNRDFLKGCLTEDLLLSRTYSSGGRRSWSYWGPSWEEEEIPASFLKNLQGVIQVLDYRHSFPEYPAFKPSILLLSRLSQIPGTWLTSYPVWELDFAARNLDLKV
jgi:hypothetical protein